MPDLFDKIRGQIDAGITKVTTKSRVTVETTRLAGQVRRITKEKEEALLRLGSRVYKEMSDSGHWRHSMPPPFGLQRKRKNQ